MSEIQNEKNRSILALAKRGGLNPKSAAAAACIPVTAARLAITRLIFAGALQAVNGRYSLTALGQQAIR